MVEYVVPAPKRRRGRPRAGESDARDRILAAAIEEFAESGYDGATMRAIAARAGVDSALVHHHFGTKADLFGEAIGAPMRPDLAIPDILAGPREQVGERIVRFVLDATHTFDLTGPDGTVIPADVLTQVTAANLHGEFATVVATRDVV